MSVILWPIQKVDCSGRKLSNYNVVVVIAISLFNPTQSSLSFFSCILLLLCYPPAQLMGTYPNDGTATATPPPPPPPPALNHSHYHHNHSHPQSHQHHQGFSVTFLVIFISIASVIALLSVLFIIVMFRRLKSRKINESNKSSRNSNKDYKLNTRITIDASPDVKSRCIYGGSLGLTPPSPFKGVQVFTYRELELATEGFSEANVIGNGRVGVVYKGILSDGTVAAIKRIHREGKQWEREFRTEVDLLSRLHTPYLVELLGYCADQHHRLLIFEFMPNGSLQQHLHPTEQQQQKPLNWGTRLRIALDCAKALEFLHEHAVPPVIHRDFKSNNVVLDHNFRAKLSDLGSSKTGFEKINANSQMSMHLLGTTGYVAPEYASTGRMTTKSDVYSYGVVLLELLTGRVPIDTKRPPGEQILVTWALPRLTNREKVVEMVDPALQGQFSKKELIQVAAIAAVCVQQEADYRPYVTDVVQSLIPLVKNLSTNFPSASFRFQSRISSPRT